MHSCAAAFFGESYISARPGTGAQAELCHRFPHLTPTPPLHPPATGPDLSDGRKQRRSHLIKDFLFFFNGES